MTRLIAAAALMICLYACSKQPATAPYAEPARTRQVRFRLYLAADYSASFYDSTFARVTLGIYKQSLTDTTTISVWDTVLTRQQIRLFPLPAQPLAIVKNVPGVYDSKYRVRAYTIVQYDNRGTTQLGGSNIPFASGSDSLLVNVTL